MKLSRQTALTSTAIVIGLVLSSYQNCGSSTDNQMAIGGSDCQDGNCPSGSPGSTTGSTGGQYGVDCSGTEATCCWAQVDAQKPIGTTLATSSYKKTQASRRACCDAVTVLYNTSLTVSGGTYDRWVSGNDSQNQRPNTLLKYGGVEMRVNNVPFAIQGYVQNGQIVNSGQGNCN
jgi:hypothetical protein